MSRSPFPSARSRVPRSSALRLLAVAGALLVPLTAFAGGPDAAKIRLAGEEFDAGGRALKDKDFALAASHFEAADAAVPGAKALRFAIRARSDAKQGSRAATLAALALARYPDDVETVKLAKEIVEKNARSLHKVSVACAPPCVLAIASASSTRAVPGEATTRWTVYLDPGPTTLSASFFGSASADTRVDAKAGGTSDVRLEPAEKPGEAKPPAAPAEPTHAAEPPPSKAEPKASTEPDPASPDVAIEAPKAGSGLPPLVFVGGLVATAAVGGVTIWSGIDTQNNPGPNAVRTACAGKGASCPEYQDGQSKETRTNVLIGVTVGVGVLTGVVGLFLTNWGGGKKEEATARIVPTAGVLPGGAAIGASGRF